MNKKYIDNHVHSTNSHDGKSSITDYINAMEDKNIEKITFTEHYDIYDGIKTNLKTIDMESYYKNYLEAKAKTDKNINFGLEIGLQPHIKKQVSELTDKYPFDFIIGSSHITCGKDIAMDNSFFDNLTREEAYLKYFKEVLQNIKTFDEFDVYGHIDYIVRYGGFPNKYIDYLEFKDILDEILTTLIKKDKGIEVNTSGFRYNINNPHPNIKIIKRYKELGGKIITIGSDAHNTNDLAKNFDDVFEILESCGFNEYTTFKNRTPQFVKIKK